jgi:septum formation protein
VLAADTTVVCGDEILGKPESAADARRMLAALSGRSHDVYTGVCVGHAGRLFSGVERTEVRFASLSPSLIDWYVATGEPMDKAGAYHIDGRGALFVTAIDGAPSNVAGLPIPLVVRLLREAGLEVEEL